MFISLLIALLGAPLPRADTVVTLGVVERDLTGDGVPEVLSLTGVGATIDSLDVTFRIQAAGQTLYAETWPITGRWAIPRSPDSLRYAAPRSTQGVWLLVFRRIQVHDARPIRGRAS
jgi:hypothetical protein